MNQDQLVKQQGGGYQNVYPLTYIQSIVDAESNEKLSDILVKYNHLYLNWQGSQENTRLSIPILIRKHGLWISYDMNGTLYTEWFKGSNITSLIDNVWKDSTNWERIPDLKFVEDASQRIPTGAILPEMLSPALQQLLAKQHNITNLVDDEDLESKCNVIRLKDKEYNPYTASGLGRKRLRKNWVKGRNLLTQSMINQPNTIYEVQYDYNLNNSTITIPEGCCLNFTGGSFKNGTIVCENTTINKGGMFSNLKLTGVYTFKDEVAGFVKMGKISDGQISSNSKQCFLHTDGYWYTRNDNAEHLIPPSAIPDNQEWSCVGLLNGSPINSSRNYNIVEGEYNAITAWNNRNSICLLLRNKHYNSFKIEGNGGKIYCIGSITPNRNNISFEICKNTFLVGRYDDKSIPASTATQGGHFIGIAITDDADVWQGYNSRQAENVEIVLNGDISTEFNANHSSIHNNNVIGIVGKNCIVKGIGGVSSSDHRGINFDFNAVNPVVEVDYINNTFNNAVSINSTEAPLDNKSKKGVIRVNSIFNCVSEKGDTNAIILCSNHVQVDVYIHSIIRDSTLTTNATHLIHIGGVLSSRIAVGYASGLDHIVRVVDVDNLTLTSVGSCFLWENGKVIVRRRNTSTSISTLCVENISSGGNALSCVLFHETSPTGKLGKFIVRNCDFSKATYSGFKYFSATNVTENNAPVIRDIHDNMSPPTYTADPNYPNIIQQESSDYANGTRSVIVYYRDPDYCWENITIVFEDELTSNRFTKTYPIKALIGNTFVETFGSLTLTVSNNPSSTGIVFNLTGGTKPINKIYKHN